MHPRRSQLRRRHDPVPARREFQHRTVHRVHFVDLTRRALLASTFRTHTVRFVDLTNPTTVTSTKCTLSHPY